MPPAPPTKRPEKYKRNQSKFLGPFLRLFVKGCRSFVEVAREKAKRNVRQLRNNSIRRTITLITAEMYVLGITFQKCNVERPIVQMHMYSTYINGVTFSNHLNFEVPNYPSHEFNAFDNSFVARITTSKCTTSLLHIIIERIFHESELELV